MPHGQELFLTLTGEGPKPGWTHILLQIFSKRKNETCPCVRIRQFLEWICTPKTLPMGSAGA